ncbi:MAG: hypothetical protein PF517_11435 [Salinivirgaceae bacterium]|jgi:hypothetical protein|nr:hypothetical protein [Salinivirgaceae bacterium]
MFETINRDMLIIFPKQPLMDWVNYIFTDYKHECPKPLEHDQGNTYLIPEFDHPDDAVQFVKQNFKRFFENELFDWSTDEKDWPEKLTWELFEKWFHYSVQSLVMDTVEGNIEKEDY